MKSNPLFPLVMGVICGVLFVTAVIALDNDADYTPSESTPIDASPHVVAPSGFEELPDLPIDFARDGTQAATFDWPEVGVCVVVGERIGLKNPVITLDVECVEMMR